MTFNVSDPTVPKLWKPEWIGTKVFLDGRLIPCVFFADEEVGIVKTYWIEGLSEDGEVCWFTGEWKPEDFNGREVSCIPGDVLRETLRGKVTIHLP